MPWRTASATRRTGAILSRDLEVDGDRDKNANRTALDAPGSEDGVQNDVARLATKRGVRAFENAHRPGLDVPGRVEDRLDQDSTGNASVHYAAGIRRWRMMQERRLLLYDIDMDGPRGVERKQREVDRQVHERRYGTPRGACWPKPGRE